MCTSVWPIFREIFIAFITAVVATYVYELCRDRRWQRRLRTQFGPLEGDYDEYERKPGEAMVKTGGVIRLKYCGSTKFTTEAITHGGSLYWHGELFMREEAGVLGEGFYSHLDTDDTGVHSVIYNSKDGHFNVSGSNTSHPEGKQSFKMVWQRKNRRFG
jgi:hypothetical protein